MLGYFQAVPAGTLFREAFSTVAISRAPPWLKPYPTRRSHRRNRLRRGKEFRREDMKLSILLGEFKQPASELALGHSQRIGILIQVAVIPDK